MSSANIPAFPISEAESQFSGLTKREYFAAVALVALHSSDSRGGHWDSTSAEISAKNAVGLADALIAALSSADRSGA